MQDLNNQELDLFEFYLCSLVAYTSHLVSKYISNGWSKKSSFLGTLKVIGIDSIVSMGLLSFFLSFFIAGRV